MDWWREFIIFIAKTMKPDNYLELGSSVGTTLSAVLPFVKEKVVGVDIRQTIQNTDKIIFYQTTTDAFFDNPPDIRYDLIFIDADHRYKQAKKDFKHAAKLLKDNGLIIIHDTYPMDKSYLCEKECADSYKLAWEIRTKMNKKFEIVTLPFHPGISIIRKSKKQLNWT